MAKDPLENFAIPNEVRAFAQQSVGQARKAFEGFIDAANNALEQMQGRAQAAHSGATEITHKSMAFAEQNVTAALEFAQKLMHAKDAAEMMTLQSEFISQQIQALSTQLQEFGQSAAKIMADAAKSKR